MIFPTVHLNGTSKSRLKEQLCAATSALRKAEASLVEAQPNARDYYPQGDSAFRTAMEEHVARLRKLGEVKAELYSILEVVDDAG